MIKIRSIHFRRRKSFNSVTVVYTDGIIGDFIVDYDAFLKAMLKNSKFIKKEWVTPEGTQYDFKKPVAQWRFKELFKR